MSVEAVNNVNLREFQYQSLDTLISFAKKKYKIEEIPVSMSKRLHGVSTKGSTIRYGYSFLRVFIKHLQR